MNQGSAASLNKQNHSSGSGWPTVLLLLAIGLSACSSPAQKEALPATGSSLPAQKAIPPATGLSPSCLGEQICGAPPGDLPPKARESANEVLEQVYALPDEEKRYFLDKRRDAVGFAIFPNVRRQGVMVATLYGKGILSYRDNGGWSPPILLTMQGQSVGPLISQQSSNIIFIFKTVCGIKDFLSGHHHVNAISSGAGVEHVEHEADPLGISVHIFDRGSTLGQSTDTYAIHIDEDANAALYGVALKPGCVLEGVRSGFKTPWVMRYFETLQLPPGQAHRILELK